MDKWRLKRAAFAPAGCWCDGAHHTMNQTCRRQKVGAGGCAGAEPVRSIYTVEAIRAAKRTEEPVR